MGYALNRIDEADAAATIAMMREYGVLDPISPSDNSDDQETLRSPA